MIAIVFYAHKSVDNNTAYVEGVKRIEAFMVKDKKRYRKTDGWGYFFIRDGLLGVRISSITLSVHLQERSLTASSRGMSMDDIHSWSTLNSSGFLR